MQNMITCAQCGAENPATNKFCGECGGRLQQPAGRMQPASEPALPAWLRDETAAPAASGTQPAAHGDDALDQDLPDWLREPASPPPPRPEPETPRRAGFDTPATGEAPALADDELPAWLRDVAAGSTANGTGPAAPEPDWLSGLGVRDDELGDAQIASGRRAWQDVPEQAMPAADARDEAQALPAWLADHPAEPATSNAPQAPGWLASDASEAAAAHPPVDDADLPAWLRDAESGPPTAASAPAQAPDALPRWLVAGEDTAAGPQVQAPATPERSASHDSELPAWLRDDARADEDDTSELLPSWLQDAARQPETEADLPAPALSTADAPQSTDSSLPAWLLESDAAPPAATAGPQASLSADAEQHGQPSVDDLSFDELPGWLRGDTPVPGPAGQAPAPASLAPAEPTFDNARPSGAPQTLAAASELPDWLTVAPPSPSEQQSGGNTDVVEDDLPEWLREPAGTSSAGSFDWLQAPSPTAPAEDALPAWLQEINDEPAPPAPEPAGAGGSHARAYDAPAEPEPAGLGSHHARAYDAPPSRQGVDEGAVGASSTPAAGSAADLPPWLTDVEPSTTATSSGLPSWLTEAEPDSATSGQASQAQTARNSSSEFLGTLDLPAWLRDAEPPQQAVKAAEPTPTWLQGSEPDVAGAPSQTAERQPPVAPMIERSPERLASIQLLERLVTEPPAERTAVPVERRHSRGMLVVQIIAFLLIIAAILAVLFGPRLGFGSQPGPSLARAAQVASDVAALPAGAPVLVAYEWDARRSAELDPLEDALITRLTAQHTPLLLMTTDPQGALLTRRRAMLLRTQPDNFYRQAGLGFVDLGFKPGGEVALARVAANFGSLFEHDWAGRDLRAEPSVLQTMCQSQTGHPEDCAIDRLGMIVVLTDRSDSVRAWIEQVASVRPKLPVVFVTPAELGPAVRPYLTATNAALVTGLRDALALQGLSGTVDDALARRAEATEAGGALFGALVLVGMIPALWSGRRARRQGKGSVWDR